jgi:ElaB/YqjD/DUF883 family membrane-anchored ribosome-binding protein
MADINTVEDDIEALTAELKVLRDDFAKIVEILGDTARHRYARAAKTLTNQMEERPVQSLCAIFGVGFLLGMMFSRC